MYDENGDYIPPKATSYDPLLPIMILLAIVIAIFMVVLTWTSDAKAEEYTEISPSNEAYCVEYAQAEGKWHSTNAMYKMASAYADCVSILPTRLEIRPRPGTAPAGDPPPDASGETWEEACAAQYRTWDASDGTVVRRGSPDRVRCPLAKIEGTWSLPPE